MGNQDPLRSFRGRCELAGHDAGGVAGQDGVLGSEAAKLTKDLSLQVDLLVHGLDNQIGVGHRLFQQCRGLDLVENAFGTLPGERPNIYQSLDAVVE